MAAVGVGYLAAGIITRGYWRPMLHVAGAAAAVSANYLSEFVLDAGRNLSEVDWIDVGSGLFGGGFGMLWYHWRTSRFNPSNRYRFED